MICRCPLLLLSFAALPWGMDLSMRTKPYEIGATLARKGIKIVCGGGRVGLMGALADGPLSAGGHVTGVMPQALVEKEIAHDGEPDLRSSHPPT